MKRRMIPQNHDNEIHHGNFDAMTDEVEDEDPDSHTEGSNEDLFNSKMKRVSLLLNLIFVLLQKLEDTKNKRPCCYGCRRWCGWIVSREKREIKLNGTTSPRTFMTNKLKNTKYNLLSFIPVVLFNQFKFFYNLFFLLIALSQFIPPLKVGFLITYVSPLAFVLTVTLLKEASDDLSRYRKDKELNNAKIECYNRRKNDWNMKSSANLKVGDIIKIY